MQSAYPEHFDREMGCTEAEWLGWLPAAIGEHPWSSEAGRAQVQFGHGSLTLTWKTGPLRVIALMRLPRLLVNFRFSHLDDAQRYEFMKRFDLYMQRGGG